MIRLRIITFAETTGPDNTIFHLPNLVLLKVRYKRYITMVLYTIQTCRDIVIYNPLFIQVFQEKLYW